VEYRVRGVVVDPSKLKNRSYTYGKQNLSNGYIFTVPVLYQVRESFSPHYITTEYPADGIPPETTLP